MRSVATLMCLICLSIAVRPGIAAVPDDFALSSGDQTFRLSSAKGKYVALHFLLKTECPYCGKHVAEVSRRGPELAGVVQVFIKPDDEAETKRWSEKLSDSGVSATIYRDPDAKLAKQLEIPDGYAFHGETVHYPALVLLGPDGKEVFRHVGKNNSDRYTFDQLAEKVGQLSKRPAVEHYNLDKQRIALAGYDPVSYFDGGKPKLGKAELTSRYRGVSYQFASEESRQKFAADPDAYCPAYGGWCATAMAEGRKVEVDPLNYKVTNGRLLLFYKGWLGNALNDWNKDEPKLTAQADASWKKLAPSDVPEKK